MLLTDSLILIQLVYCVIALLQLVYLYFYAKRRYKWLDLKAKPDFSAISQKIKETESMLSVHNILLEMIPAWAEESPEKWIPELEETVAEAQEALENLKRLQYGLQELAAELERLSARAAQLLPD